MPTDDLFLAGSSSRRWSSNPSEKCSYERPTWGTVCGTMRSMCGADAGYLAVNYHSLYGRMIDDTGATLANVGKLHLVDLAGSECAKTAGYGIQVCVFVCV